MPYVILIVMTVFREWLSRRSRADALPGPKCEGHATEDVVVMGPTLAERHTVSAHIGLVKPVPTSMGALLLLRPKLHTRANSNLFNLHVLYNIYYILYSVLYSSLIRIESCIAASRNTGYNNGSVDVMVPCCRHASRRQLRFYYSFRVIITFYTAYLFIYLL